MVSPSGVGSLLSPLGETAKLPVSPAQILLQQLLTSSILIEEDWNRLSPEIREEALALTETAPLLAKLVESGALTRFQSDRIRANAMSALILGNYRVLERIGSGGMGVVFKAEHLDLRRLAAIKLVAIGEHVDPRVVGRFNSEMRAVAQLRHPNIVSAIDAGRLRPESAGGLEYRYFVMEYVPGRDLDSYVRARGPFDVGQACDLIHQVASALDEANRHNLVHRDIKPSNICVTPEGQAKLLDFGLALNHDYRITQPGMVLGTVEYMAPEQATDAGSVDIRADIYALGGTLFWCLTGAPPFPPTGGITGDIARRLMQPAPSPRAIRPDLPVELDAIVRRMLAQKPADRFPTPRSVMRALVPFLTPGGELRVPPASSSREAAESVHRLLIVDDDSQVREFVHIALRGPDIACDEATNGADALRMVKSAVYDLVVLDIDMPGLSGHEVCRRLREDPPTPHLKIIMFSGRASTDEMAQIMNEGADDFITKPFSVVQLQARVRAALRLKSAQRRAEQLTEQLLVANQGLQKDLALRGADLNRWRQVLVQVLVELIDQRGEISPAHAVRMPLYCRRLAEQAAKADPWRSRMDDHFFELLESCVPLHDIGNATLPESILKKPGRLTPEERFFMQTHTAAGAEILNKVARRHGLTGGFVAMALDVIRHHHERFDGQGYPDRLAGESIPLSARIVAIADVYDALRSRRSYKPALSHAATVEMMTSQGEGQFDPFLLALFNRQAGEFERIYRDHAE